MQIPCQRTIFVAANDPVSNQLRRHFAFWCKGKNRLCHARRPWVAVLSPVMGVTMIVFALFSILSGAFTTMTVLLLSGASWGQIALGYVVGGWGGLLLGAALLACSCWCRRIHAGLHLSGLSGRKAR